eukprot:3653886-Lingulodinium_polyedra.AAC.1
MFVTVQTEVEERVAALGLNGTRNQDRPAALGRPLPWAGRQDQHLARPAPQNWGNTGYLDD